MTNYTYTMLQTFIFDLLSFLLQFQPEPVANCKLSWYLGVHVFSFFLIYVTQTATSVGSQGSGVRMSIYGN